MLVGKEWRKARTSESVTFDAGVRHTFRNTSGAEVIVRNVHDPHHDFEAYIRSIAKVSQQMQAMTPKSPRGGHADVPPVASPRGPDPRRRCPMRVAFGLLQGVGRLIRQWPPE
jgi:hypothetical protein